MQGWMLWGGCALAGCLPLVLGWPAAAVMLILMPVLVECAREAGKPAAGAVFTGVLAAVCCWQFPGVWSLVAVWCSAGVAMSLVTRGHGVHRVLAWMGVCVAVVCGVLVWLGQAYQGQIFAGLAQMAVDAIDASPQGSQLLLQCYQMGLARLDENVTPLFSLMGMVLMTREVELQLLYSLRTTLEDLLQALIPQVLVGYVIVTCVLVAAVPDIVRRKRGLEGRLPHFGQWQLPDSIRRYLNALVLLYLVQLFTDSSVMALMGTMSAAAFQYVYIIYGLAVMEGMTKRFGTAKLLRRLWMTACTLFAPVILIVLGVVDRMADLRNLRGPMDDKGGL